MRRSRLGLFVVGFLVALPGHRAMAQEATATSDVAAQPDAAVEDFLRSYTLAFAEGDAQKLADFWAERAEWESTVTGEQAAGRDQIIADLEAFFQENPGAQLTGSIDSATPVAPGVVCLDGQATLTTADGEPEDGCFHAVLVASGDKWQFAKVVESAPPVLETPYYKLQELEFLLGEWQDERDGSEEAPRVSTTFRWGSSQTFLIRSYTIEDEEGESQGTQVIGWDPAGNHIRSWSFHSDGSFGEGTWLHAGSEWTGRLAQTLADGSAASATQVIRVVDGDTLEVETVGREVDGEPLPASPAVTMKRVEVESDSDPAATSEEE